jgi:hypothetical protein
VEQPRASDLPKSEDLEAIEPMTAIIHIVRFTRKAPHLALLYVLTFIQIWPTAVTRISELEVTGDATIGTNTGADVLVVNGNSTFNGTDSANGPIFSSWVPVGATSSNVPSVYGQVSGTWDTTSGVLNAIGVRGQCIATRSAGASDLRCNGIYGEASTAQDNRAVRGISASAVSNALNWAGVFTNTSSGATAISKGVEGTATGASQQNFGGYFDAANASLVNWALYTVSGDVALNTVGGSTQTFRNTLLGDGNTDLTQIFGHVRTNGTAPTLSSCGTGALDAGGSDQSFILTADAGGTTCTITFSRTWTVRPSCQVFPQAGVAMPTCTISATAITCTVVVASAVYHWSCNGMAGAT